MSSWSDGYVSDVEYLPGFYVEQTPNHIQLACLLNGFQPPLSSPSFSYCELGCGQGTTASIIAGAYPHATVVAVDFNPAQIARAQREARASGLNNIEFIEASFEEFSERNDFGPFDIVSLHGVWSWISEENRVFIVNFLKRMVKPGGAVAISYNSMPGWTSILPFQKMILERARLSSKRSDGKVVEALDFIEVLQKAGCSVVGNTEFFSRFRPSNKTRSETDHATYLAHEYLNENWRPMYFTDTSRLLEAAKLDFVASASLLDNFSDLMLTPDQKIICDSFPQPEFRELIKDFCVNRPFRRDIYIKGAQKISDLSRNKLLEDISLALIVPDSALKFKLNTPAGEATLPREIYEPVYGYLSSGPKAISFLLDKVRKSGNVNATEIAGLLVGSGQAASIHWEQAGATDANNLFNQMKIAKVLQKEEPMATLAVPKIGSGLNVNAIEAVIFNLLTAGTNLADLRSATLAILVESEGPLNIDGEITTDKDKIKAALEDAYDWFLKNTFQIWKNIGLID